MMLFDSLLEVSVLLVLFAFYLLGYRPPWWWWLPLQQQQPHLKKQTNDIPGPLALPLVGSRWVFVRWLGGYDFTEIHRFYASTFAKYGPIVREEALWNIPVISVVTRADIERVLRASGKYPIRPPTEAIAYYRKSRPDRYASTGLVNEQGEQWYKLRTNLTNDLTSMKTITSFLPFVEAISDDWCNLIKLKLQQPHNTLANLEDLASRFGLEAICTLVLGRRMGFLLPSDHESDNLTTTRLAKAVNNHFLACRDTYYGLPFWKLYPTKSYKKLVESEEEIYNLVLELIENEGSHSFCKESVVFQSVLNANIDDREKTAAIVDFIAAGIYTMRNSLIFLLHSVAASEEIQQKIIADTTYNYTRACVNETFRLLPTASCLARVIEQDLILSDYHIKAGSVVLCHTGLACRDANNFKQPLEFMPERWLNAQKAETASAATFLVVPFGVGRRTCPGKRFIEQTLPVILKQTVERFSLSIVNELELRFEFLLAPKTPVDMIFNER